MKSVRERQAVTPALIYSWPGPLSVDNFGGIQLFWEWEPPKSRKLQGDMGQTNEEFDPELNELQFYWDKADTLGIVKIALDEGKPAAALYLAHYLVEE